MILTHDLAVILDNGYSGVIALSPVVPRINIVHPDLDAAADARQQILDQDLAEVATPPAIDIELLHVSLRMDGVKRRRQLSRRSRRRLANAPAVSPAIAASAVPASPRASA